MNVISKNAESLFLRTTKEHWAKKTAARCLYMRLSMLGAIDGERRSRLLRCIDEFLGDRRTFFFVCHDADVFLLNWHLTKKKIAELIAHLNQNFAPAISSNYMFDERLASLFEVDVDWKKIQALGEKKVELLEIVRMQEAEKLKQDEAKKLEQRNKLIMKSKADAALVETLSSRRSRREKSEILVVEDDLFSQRLVKNAIGGSHDVSTASSGAEALLVYAKKAPDLVFLDIGLPDIDGHTILKKIFEMDKDAYVVMLSGNGNRKNVMAAMTLGAKGFVGKPFTKDKLFEYIKKSPFIQNKQAIDTLVTV